MAIVNRDLDASQQRLVIDTTTGVVGVSSIIHVGIAPCACQPISFVSNAFGLSGSPILGIQVQRFVTGVGFTTIALNGSSLLTVAAMSTSGMQKSAVPASGSTLALLQAGDDVQIVTSGANTAATYMFACVLQILQDVQQTYGV